MPMLPQFKSCSRFRANISVGLRNDISCFETINIVTRLNRCISDKPNKDDSGEQSTAGLAIFIAFGLPHHLVGRAQTISVVHLTIDAPAN